MSYLLDTNACIAIINGRPETVRLGLEETIAAAAPVWMSSIVAFELWYGVVKSSRPEANANRLNAFLGGPVMVLPFEPEDAQAAGTLRANLEAPGRPIGAYDLLIAGQALRRELTLVTANVSEFRRVKGLAWEDWAKPR
ncbi:MAG: type II toxin-antitoxin system VapC family toxin [Terriglobia bacterium]